MGKRTWEAFQAQRFSSHRSPSKVTPSTLYAQSCEGLGVGDRQRDPNVFHPGQFAGYAHRLKEVDCGHMQSLTAAKPTGMSCALKKESVSTLQASVPYYRVIQRVIALLRDN